MPHGHADELLTLATGRHHQDPLAAVPPTPDPTPDPNPDPTPDPTPNQVWAGSQAAVTAYEQQLAALPAAAAASPGATYHVAIYAVDEVRLGFGVMGLGLGHLCGGRGARPTLSR